MIDITDERIVKIAAKHFKGYAYEASSIFVAFVRDIALHPSASAAPGQLVPKGWVVVPEEPTPEMLKAGVNLMLNSVRQEEIAAGYQAMLAASHPPPTEDVEQMILDCVPGGSICDPQQVADNLRAWVARRMAA